MNKGGHFLSSEFMLKICNSKKLKGMIATSIPFLVWVLFIFGGTYKLLMYEYTPGKENNFSAYWPATSELQLSNKPYTLVMVVHPKCGCSKASLGELSKLVARFPNVLDVKILFIEPKDAGPDWMLSENWAAANEIAGAEVHPDTEGTLAQAFKVKTSGITLLYNREGGLLFHGGITASRGHWGDNTGSQAIGEIISKGSSATSTTAVFGCNLFNKS